MHETGLDQKHLRQRRRHWHYYRRVPKKYQAYDNRGTIRRALGTVSLETACMRRDELVAADDEFWASMALADATAQGGGIVRSDISEQRYRAACAQAMAAGFRYVPMDRLVDGAQIEDVVERMLALKTGQGEDDDIQAFQAASL